MRAAVRRSGTRALLGLLALGLLLPGADGAIADPGRPAARETQAPEPFAPAVADAAAQRCSDLSPRENTGLAVSFAVPAGYRDATRDDGGCRVTGRDFRDLGIAFGRLPTLATTKADDVDPYVGSGGDDDLEDVAYADDVPVFGAVTGERLSFYCFCDGQSLDALMLQAHGVRLSWTTPRGEGPSAAELAAVTDSVGLAADATSTCRARGTTVAFTPPIPRTESIDRTGSGCHLYLTPGRASLQRYAEVVPAPSRSLAAFADGLRDRARVSHVRSRGDRLTWRYTRLSSGAYGAPTGTWRFVAVQRDGVRVQWSARPRQWQVEAPVAAAFFASAAVVSG